MFRYTRQDVDDFLNEITDDQIEEVEHIFMLSYEEGTMLRLSYGQFLDTMVSMYSDELLDNVTYVKLFNGREYPHDS